MALGSFGSVVAVDESGAEAGYIDGLGEPVVEFPSIAIPVVQGQNLFMQPNDPTTPHPLLDPQIITLGDVHGPAWSGGTIGQHGWSGATGGHDKLIVSGDEVIRLALKVETRWRLNADPDPDEHLFNTYLSGFGQGGCYLTIEQVSTAGCIGCGSGSGSGSGSESTTETGCCTEELEEHPDLEMVVPDGPNAGTHTGVWNGALWVFSDVSVRLACEAGVWSMRGFPASAQACNPFLLTFDGAILAATTDITVSVE